MKILIILFALLVCSICQDTTYTKYYDQCKKIVANMTLQQKVGQTLQIDFNAITNDEKQQTDPTQAVTWAVGGLLMNGNSAPTEDGNIARLPSLLEADKLRDAYLKKTRANWKKVLDRFTDLGVQVTTKDKQKYKIKFLLGSDASHGDQNIVGSTIFPHNIGLSCSHNQAHFQNLGYWTKQSMQKTGLNLAYGPSVAVSHNPQWGKFYQSIGQQDTYMFKYGQSYVKGLMDVQSSGVKGVMASAKSFFGDGATRFGANQGSASVINWKNYLNHNSPGYKGSIASSLGSVVISHSATNLIPSAYQSYLKLGYLRDELGFSGFTVTDYDQIRRVDNEFLPRTFFNVTQEEGYAMIVNSGTDMLMLSGEKLLVERILKHGKKSVEKKVVFERRLDQSVVRILAVKMAMGLVVKVNSVDEIQQPVIQQAKITESKPLTATNQYADSLNAVHESLVLIKNTNVLPVKAIKSTIEHIILVGQKTHNLNRLTKIQLFRNFDNIGMQCGGLTVREQGFEGNDFWTGDNKASSNASSLLDALKALQKTSKFTLYYPDYSSLTNEVIIQTQRQRYVQDLKLKRKSFNSKNTLILGVFGQFPYADTVGDVNIPYCKIFDGPGCIWSPQRNPYCPGSQLRSLQVDFSSFQKDVIDAVKGGADKNVPLVSILFSGRPLLAEKIINQSQAFVAAWLPGTSGGQGVLDAITGDYVFRANGQNDRRNTLSMDWPKTMDTLSNFPIYDSDGQVPQITNTLFKVGYGLPTVTQQQILKQQ